MAPHITTTAADAHVLDTTDLMRHWRAGTRRARPSRMLFWALLVAALVLDAAVIGLGARLLGLMGPSEPRTEKHPAIPFADNPDLWNPLRHWIVQEGGRNQPFEVFSREAIRRITGRERFEDHDPVPIVAMWMLSDEASADWEHYPFILCESAELRAILRREEAQSRHVAPAAVRSSAAMKRLLAAVKKKDRVAPTPLEASARGVGERLALYDRLRAGDIAAVALDANGPGWLSPRVVCDFADNQDLWYHMLRARRLDNPRRYDAAAPQPLPETEVKEVAEAFASLRGAYRNGDADRFRGRLDGFLEAVARASTNVGGYPAAPHADLERWLIAANPFGMAAWSALAASMFLGMSLLCGRWRWIATALYGPGLAGAVACLIWAGIGFHCRATISGRLPATNLYESLLWGAFLVAALSFGLELASRRRVIGLAGVLVSCLGFFLAGQMSPTIAAPNPAARTWLLSSLTFVPSGAAFALAWGFGLLLVAVPRRHEPARILTANAYRSIQIGMILMAAGLLLSGVESARSWGRFWMWSPKEVWSVAALLGYAALLHARSRGRIGDFGLAIGSAMGFAAVLAAWIGPTTSLHSPAALGIAWAALVHLSFFCHAALRNPFAVASVPVAN